MTAQHSSVQFSSVILEWSKWWTSLQGPRSTIECQLATNVRLPYTATPVLEICSSAHLWCWVPLLSARPLHTLCLNKKVHPFIFLITLLTVNKSNNIWQKHSWKKFGINWYMTVFDICLLCVASLHRKMAPIFLSVPNTQWPLFWF